MGKGGSNLLPPLFLSFDEKGCVGMQTSTLYSYVKSMQLQQKWQMRQEGWVTDADLRTSTQIESGSADATTAARRASLSAKLKSGKQLSPGEFAWLQKHDPGLYRQAKRAELERTRQKNALRLCRSKEEAGRRYRGHLQWIACGAVEAVRKATTASERMEISEGSQMCHSALRDEFQRFKSTTRYKRLPARRSFGQISGRWA